MTDKNLVLAISSQERSRILARGYAKNQNELSPVIESWRNKKTIVTDEQFELALLTKKCSKAEFAVGVKKLTLEDADQLYLFLQNQEWYQLHTLIMDKTAEDEQEEFNYFARPYKVWLQEKLTQVIQLSSMSVSEEVKQTILDVFISEISQLSLKTIVYDQNEFFETEPSNSHTNYFNRRFRDKAGYLDFFNDYPVLARLLAIRAQFMLDNMVLFLESITTLSTADWQTFSIEKPLNLESLTMDKGDSHDQGKSVILFVLNGQKLVFKYKNLEVGNRFNLFLQELEDLSPDLSFYQLKRVVKKTFTIEECVAYQPCESEEEVSLFYQRFGQLIGITHLLRGNDFHLENLIAVGSYPVLIDIETLIQNTANALDKGNASSQYSRDYVETIMGTSLLPNIHEEKQGQIEFSALNGDEQLLSEKVLQLVSDDSGRMKMEYLDYTMPGSDNLPVLKGEKVNWLAYSQDILAGFTTIYELLINHKDFLAERVETLFSGVKVRNVLKATQKYAEMLDYGYHPSYMTNYVNREKLFENIWAYSYQNLAVVPYEIADLLVNDIPIFYNISDERGLLTSSGKVLPGFYQKSAVDLVKERFAKLSQSDFAIQENRLTIALNLYKGECQEVTLEKQTTELIKAVEIADIIYDQLIFGSRRRDVTLPRYTIDQQENWKKDCMTANFYDGLGGIYLFYRGVQQESPDPRYEELLNIMDQMFFKRVTPIKDLEQYANNLSLLYLLSKKIQERHNLADSLTANQLLETIQTYYRQTPFNNEWLFGRASLLKLCLNLYQLPYFTEVKPFIEELIADIELEKMDNASFAHGYAGVVYSLCCALEIFPENQLIISKLRAFVAAMEQTDYIYDGTNTTWCNGLVGIGIALQKLMSVGVADDLIFFERYQDLLDAVLTDDYEDDCLCHGTTGSIEFFKEALNDSRLDSTQVKSIRKFIAAYNSRGTYYLQGLKTEPGYDLMTGLAGIGYTHLRSNTKSVSNILVLE